MIIDISSRPTHVGHPTIDQLCAAMRAAGRSDLIHYAGASYRDSHAWRVCLEWIADPGASAASLSSRIK